MRKRSKVLMALGAACLAAALGLTAYNLYDEYRAEKSSDESLSSLRITIREKEDQPLLPEPQMMMTELKVDGRGYVGILDVPSLELSLPVQGEWSEQLLKYSPCLYEGNLYDGMIIAGHNYRSHFSPLKRLVPGEEIRFTDVDGNVWTYELAGTEIIDGMDVEGMKSGDWDLTLFTCTYGGRERYTLRCSMVIE